jgi:hypothetical protein
MLNKAGINSHLVEVIDNNCIDKEVTKFKPTVVIIEAFWVVPEKFEILHKLHPKVLWVIRNHSNWPFASTEGSLMDWSIKYLAYENVFVSCNKFETFESFKRLAKIAYPLFTQNYLDHKVIYLPNYYPTDTPAPTKAWRPSDEIHIGNFGAVRPLKNNLIQAIAAITFANEIGKKLYYYINGLRIEGKAQPVVKSIITLFENVPNAKLYNIGWKDHKEFLALCANMDLITQVSFDETFNIVLADAVTANTPVVGSKEIPWLIDESIADCTDVADIVKKMHKAYQPRRWWQKSLTKLNKDSLKEYAEASKKQWLGVFGH